MRRLFPAVYLSALLSFFSAEAWAASNIYFLYGEQGSNYGIADPLRNPQVIANVNAAAGKGYHLHIIHGIAPETFLRILSHPETFAVFYIGHALATQEQINQKQASISVLQGGEYKAFDGETLDLALARLHMHGEDYEKASNSVRYLHLGTCYGTSCETFFRQKLKLPSSATSVSWDGGLPGELVISDYSYGEAARMFASLPIAPPTLNVTGWDQLNQEYRNTLIDDLIKLRIVGRKSYTIEEVLSIKRSMSPTAAQLQKLIDLAKPKIKTTADLYWLMRQDFDYYQNVDDVGELKTKAIKRLFSKRLTTQRGSILDLKAICWDAGLSSKQIMDIYETTGVQNVGSLDDFVELIMVDQDANRNHRQFVEEFARKYTDYFLKKFAGTQEDLL
jgi:hypothetical protein